MAGKIKKYSNNYSQYKWIEVSDQETETYRRDIDNRHTTKDQNIKRQGKWAASGSWKKQGHILP